MSDLRVASGPADADGRVLAVTPERAGWRYVDFSVFALRDGARLRRTLARRELCVVVLGGRCIVRSEAGEWSLGERATPFDGPPAAAYLPPGSAFEIEADGEVELAFGSAPAERGAAARPLASPRLEMRGSGVTQRRIQHILMEDESAESLLVTEVVTPAGHWSSYPPHKHDTSDPPRETALEEVYYHRLRDQRGFALQRVYTADRTLDESLTVRNGECVLVPRGYHTVSAAPGYELYYLNVMSGPVREWKVTFDPDHRRLMG